MSKVIRLEDLTQEDLRILLVDYRMVSSDEDLPLTSADSELLGANVLRIANRLGYKDPNDALPEALRDLSRELRSRKMNA
jgi:hypothetical protein